MPSDNDFGAGGALTGLPAAVAAAAAAIAEPIHAAIAAASADLGPDATPAYAFDPVAAAGGPPPRRAPHAAVAAPVPSRPDSPDELAWLPIADLTHLVAEGKVRALDAVDAYCARIERLNPRLNAVLTPTFDAARREAINPRPGRLTGVPLGLKDIVEVAGVRTTGGSRLLADHVSTADSAVWSHLRSEGAILLAKLHTHEFAAGPTGENEAFGPARNPWDAGKITGGSSSGSAAATATAMVAGAIGTDTGGSIRIPAALCGVVGLKPTYGRVDTRGIYPLSWSLDHAGPLARNVRDAALLLDVLAPAPDGTRAEAEALAGAVGDLRGVRVAVPADWLAEGMQADVRRAFAAALDVLRELGAHVEEREMPAKADLLMAVNRAIALPEGTAWHEPFLRAGRGGEYGANVRPRKEAGRLVGATEYLQAQRLRNVLCRRFGAEVWRDVDLLALPTLPIEAPAIGQASVALDDGSERPTVAALLAWNGPVNVLGAPAISVPCGRSAADLPIGLQLIGRPGDDAFVCYAAAAYESRTPWHTARPPAAG
jgi:aspartyl-tRNA(Asn)/glutamyl-tRNA(Gln) amidotransferase subunit A